MTFTHHDQVNVMWRRGSHDIAIGRLAQINRTIYFEYSSEFIAMAIEISPYKLPLKPGLHVCEERLFEGLFGVFNDSLPDGWGRLLLDRHLLNLGVAPSSLSPLDRLCFVGENGMGALVYQPAIDEQHHVTMDLDVIAAEVQQFQESEAPDFVDDLLALNGSSSGARPKALIRRDDGEWIIKFRSSLDKKDIGPIEFAYHQMAIAAGLNVPIAKLFSSKKGPGYFGVQRFDRSNSVRQHMHTLSGLLHADHRLPSLDYETVLKATLWLTKDVREVEKQFRAALFNVLSHNRDDHAKNFSFVMDDAGQWSLSPAYDLTFSDGPRGEHCTLICGEGQHPSLEHVQKLAQIAGIKKDIATKVIDEVQSAVAQWDVISRDVGVSATSRKFIQNVLNKTNKNFMS